MSDALPRDDEGKGPAPARMRPRLPRGANGWFVLALFLSQGLQFGYQVWANSGGYLFSDNTFYETPAWSLASGRGLSIPRAEWEDPYLTARFVARHPERDASHIPSVTFAPGYAWYLALVYWFAGRSHLAAVLANGPLLAITLMAFTALVFVCLKENRPQRIALFLGALFPFWAFWAARIMSDTLCNALLATAVLVWLLAKPGSTRPILVGLLMGAAILTRPYAALLPPVVVLLEALAQRWPEVKQALVVTIVSTVCLGLWVARNYSLFGVPLVTGMGLGYNIWQASYEAEIGRFSSVDSAAFHTELAQLGIGDAHFVEAHERFMAVVWSRVRAEPLMHLAGALTGIPRLWVSQGRGTGMAPRLALGAWLGSLLFFMVVGAGRAIREGDERGVALIVPVVYYTVAFMTLHIESRYVLPVRPMGLILSASGIDWVLRSVPLGPRRR